MAGLYTLSNNGVKMSIGELDRLMDEAVDINAGKMTPIQALTVPLAFRAVDMIAGAVSRMPFYIEDASGNDVTEQNTPRYMSELMYKLTASLEIFNGAYCLKESNQFGLNSRYRFLPSPLVRWDTSKGEITRFEYNVDGTWTNIPNFEKSLLWWWWPNLTSEVGPGVGPMNAALQDIGLASSLTHFAESYFSRGGFPLTILSIEGNISEPAKVLNWWNAMVRGARQAFKAILLTNKITPTVIGSNIKDTIAPELYQQAAHNVAIAFGIPLSLLLSDAANYATALGDHVRFYTETVIPLAERIFEQWNERVYEPQGLEIEIWPDDLEIMQSYQLEQASAVVPLVGSPVLTVKEGRQLLGYETTQDASQTQEEAQAVVFNGAQVQAASDIVVKVSAGELPRNSGIAMLVSFFGMTEQQAAQIIGDAGADGTTQPSQPVAEQTATPEPVTEVPDETQDDAIETERKALRRYAHNRLRDGKPFAFRSDVIGLPEIEAIKSCATHDAIDAAVLETVKAADITALIDAINAARAELKAVANV